MRHLVAPTLMNKLPSCRKTLGQSNLRFIILNKSRTNSVDKLVERFNQGLSRLLGKKDKNPTPPPQTNNITFFWIVVACCVFIWLCTGFYFINKNEYALIFINSKIVDVKHGVKVGFVLPYPFGDVVVINGAASDVLTIGNSAANSFIVLDKNRSALAIKASFSYQVTNAKTLYLNYLQAEAQNRDNLDNEIMQQVQNKIRAFVASRDIAELRSGSYAALSSELAGILTISLNSYGITLNKFNIINFVEQPAKSQIYNQTTSTAGAKPKGADKVQLKRANNLGQTGVVDKAATNEHTRLVDREVKRDTSGMAD